MTGGGSGEGETVRAFWHGGPLSHYQLLCLRSFVARGHRVELFSYQDGLETPDWIVRRNAQDILPADRVLHYRWGPGQGSPALHSNVFRYAMLHRLGGWWIDTDVALLGAQLPAGSVFFAAEQADSGTTTAVHADPGPRFGTAALKLPRQHPLLAEAVERCLALGETAAWSQTGPVLFTELVGKHQLSRHASPQNTAYPIPWFDIVAFFDPARCDEVRNRCERSTFVHLWNELWRRRGIPGDRAPPPGSFLDWLVRDVNFDLKFRGQLRFFGPPADQPPAKEVSPVGRGTSRGQPFRRLIFAFAPPADAWPSALLRGRQLLEIIGGLRSDIECRAVALNDLFELRGECVILTKSALFASTRDTISRLRTRGHRLVADFVDGTVDNGIAASVDFLLASSASQHLFFQLRFPQIPALHVTHHIDLRMPRVATPTDQARFGYYGKLQNCLHAREIADLVRIVDANDALDTRWMARLAESNAHYAIRGPEAPGVFKPFLKGFTAAYCGVPVIVASPDEEARHYLGTDYPFVVGGLSLGSVREHIRRFAGEYATATWQSAVETMRAVARRSSREYIEQELRAVLNAIL